MRFLTDEEENVDNTPECPGQGAGCLDRADLGDRLGALSLRFGKSGVFLSPAGGRTPSLGFSVGAATLTVMD